MSEILVWHHADLDGICAAAIIHNYYSGHNDRVTHKPVSYNKPIPFDSITPNMAKLYIVDFSLQKDGNWESLYEYCAGLGIDNIVWIDHHESELKRKKPEWVDQLKGIRDINRCGAMLTWQYFNNLDSSDDTVYLGGSPPEVVKVVDKWDRWIHEDDPKILNFVAGMRVQDKSNLPYSYLWSKLLRAFYWDRISIEIRNDGRTIRKYNSNTDASYIHSFGFEVEFEGHKCYAVNRGMTSSKAFDSLHKKYDILMPFVFDGKQWTITMYSETVNVGAIALKYGGGGHRGAAGFQHNNLSFLITCDKPQQGG